MFLSYYYFFSFILLFHLQISSSSICSEIYSSETCECEDLSYNGQIYLSLKCTQLPNLQSNLNYRTIEFESCLEDLNFEKNPFNNLKLNILRIRHCNLININNQTFSNLKEFEKFYLENSTMKLFSTSHENFQNIFSANSFQTLKSLTLKNIHYHSNENKFNLELLLQQLPRLYRLELINIHLDNYRYHHIHSIGQDLTYLSLTNTHQTSLLPIEYFQSLERLLIRHLPDIFQTQPFISSLGKLKYLKYILFEHNQLKSITNLQSNSIDDIDLSSNLIQSIDEYTFEHVPKLRQLTLTGNPLKSIDKNAFCGIENLQRLSIHIKHQIISPLDNCILLNYPHLQIIQDSQTKFLCNCQLMYIFLLQRQQSIEINRIFKYNQVCLLQNQTMKQNLYELEHYFNCSITNQCHRLCQDRKLKIPTILSTNIQSINSKYSSLSISLYSFFSYLLFLLLLGLLYLS